MTPLSMAARSSPDVEAVLPAELVESPPSPWHPTSSGRMTRLFHRIDSSQSFRA